MEEIHSDDRSTVAELGRDPWLHTDWQGLFEQVAGSSEPPLQSDTLSLAVSDNYGCDQEFGETIVRKAAECGQLLRISVKLEDLRWEYYAAKSVVITEPCNWISITDGDVLADADSLAPEAVSRDELVQQVESRPRQTPIKQVQYIADNIEHLAPFHINDGDLKLQPRIAELILLRRSHAQIVKAASHFTPADEGPAFTRVLEALADYEKAEKTISKR
ncbi:hypothetical protein [Halarchaeum sp. P4]|uniref:hypothetical protein n=1 Tax=Halarchaeum sp. P4 TaxID=3421639 RepID=UPI003EBA190F